MSPDAFDSTLAIDRDEEALFARDVAGQLIRVEALTQRDYDTPVTLSIDGDEVTVMKAVPSTDAQGNIIIDDLGRTVPRRTTIYDAVTRVFNTRRGAALGLRHPVPTLCHREHMNPVGVCRVCVVALGRRDGGGQRNEERLVPACVHPVEPGMVVHTMESPQPALRERIESSVRVVVELMAADHLGSAGLATAGGELASLSRRVGADAGRFRLEARVSEPPDRSSHMIEVDRDRCVMCDRCSRACNEVRSNFVIGRSGKGYEARIAFDLDVDLGDSTCVSCGECMTSCPTDALHFRKPVESDWRRERLAAPETYFEVSAEDLKRHPLFEDMPLKFLQWNVGAVIGWRVARGQVLCRQGETGGTAFVLLSGHFGYWRQEAKPGGLLAWITPLRRAGSGPPVGPPDGHLTPAHLIVGEMTCMNNQPRTATVAALEDGEVWIVRRNLLYVVQRDRHAREKLDRIYRERALQNHLRDITFFADLDDTQMEACRHFLSTRVELVRVDPGQIIFKQGEPADAFYMIRHGHVKATQVIDGEPRVLSYLRPNMYFGETGLVSREVVDAEVTPDRWDRRSATCSALDHVEVVRIRRDDFRTMLQTFPPLLKMFVDVARRRLGSDRGWNAGRSAMLETFLDQGFYNGEKMLVMDLEACTRCDLCVEACADGHGGVSRLVREGPTLGRFMVASACRSCTDPYCLVGCPVDAIHREGSLETVIEDHCIGCGQCAKNCPYHNIRMIETGEGLTAQRQAATCDLCRDLVRHPGSDEVRCVYSCPHHAAMRISGDELWRRLTEEGT
jgi:CRP-like cAMP-binding protein/Fe-S-cluster-containing hydrogenase component 2